MDMEHGIQRLTINFSGQVRRTRYQGRDYLVAPMTLINPGVLNGSKGSLLYPPDEIAKNSLAWNGVPIVVYHPHRHGQPVSATEPGILDSQGVGVLRNATSNGKLRAEGWFDEIKTKRVNPSVYNRLIKGEPIELSTGLYTDNEDRSGTFNGRQYTAIARNYRPDHLAVLPDQVGACSLQDGCGVLVNKENAMLLKDKLSVLLGNRDGPCEDEHDPSCLTRGENCDIKGNCDRPLRNKLNALLGNADKSALAVKLKTDNPLDLKEEAEDHDLINGKAVSKMKKVKAKIGNLKLGKAEKVNEDTTQNALVRKIVDLIDNWDGPPQFEEERPQPSQPPSTSPVPSKPEKTGGPQPDQSPKAWLMTKIAALVGRYDDMTAGGMGEGEDYGEEPGFEDEPGFEGETDDAEEPVMEEPISPEEDQELEESDEPEDDDEIKNSVRNKLQQPIQEKGTILSNKLSLLVGNAWSDEARAAALEARRAGRSAKDATTRDGTRRSLGLGESNALAKEIGLRGLNAGGSVSGDHFEVGQKFRKAGWKEGGTKWFKNSVGQDMRTDLYMKQKYKAEITASAIPGFQPTKVAFFKSEKKQRLLDNAWSDEARAAALEARRAGRSAKDATSQANLSGVKAFHEKAAALHRHAQQRFSKAGDKRKAIMHQKMAERHERFGSTHNQRGGPTMANVKLTKDERKAVVDGLITNEACCWEEGDREVLNALGDVTLAKLYKQQELLTNAEEEGGKDVFKVKNDPMGAQKDELEEDDEEDVSVEEEKTHPSSMSANSLNRRDREVLAFGYRQLNQIRKGHVAKITANANNRFTVKQLEGMSETMLANLAKLAEPVETVEQDSLPSFFGAQGASSMAANVDSSDEAPLQLGHIDYQELAKAR